MAWDGYIRVSQVRGRGGESFISPDVQRDSIERWAAGRGVDVVCAEPELDVSGGTLDRPVLERLLQRIWDGESEGIVVWKLNRLSRAGAGEALTLVKKIVDKGAGVVAVEDGVDPATPGGKIMLAVMLTLAEIELDGIREGWKVARQRANARGVFIGPVPIGYDRRADGTLEINADAEHVRRAFRISAGLDADEPDLPGARAVGTIGVPRDLHAVLDYLRGVFPDRRWSVTVAEKLLKQRLYLGRMAHGEFVTTFPELAIVDPMLWEFAQHERAIVRRTKLAPDFPLVGIARCGTCGRGMVAQISSGRGRVKDRRYRCIGCDAPPSCLAAPLEALVLDAIRSDPPTLNTDEMSQRTAVMLAAVSALNDTMAMRERYEDLGDLDRWEELVTKRDDELRVARLAADATSTAPLPDLTDPSPADMRRAFERAVGSLVVHRLPAGMRRRSASLADRVELELRA